VDRELWSLTFPKLYGSFPKFGIGLFSSDWEKALGYQFSFDNAMT
jgi:hypothetical protein